MLAKEKWPSLASRMGRGQWKEAALRTTLSVAHQRNKTLMDELPVLASPPPVVAAAARLPHPSTHPHTHPHVRVAISVQLTATQANVI